MAVEELGLAVVVKGFAKFIGDLKAGDKAIGAMAAGWEKAGGAAGKAATKFTTVSQTIGRMAGKTEAALSALQPLGIAFSAAAASGALLIRSSTMIAARNEELAIVLQTVGKNAGYTADQLNSYEAAIKGLGITTQSARQSMVQMMQANIDLAHSTDLARLAQDAAVIAQVDSSEAFSRLITIIQTGNVLMGRRLGLNLDFAAANKRLAASLGITTDALTQEQRMQARVNEVMSQGTRIAGTYEAAMGSAGKQMRSLNRHWEEARAALGTAFLPMLSRAVKVVGDVLKAFNNLDAGTQKTIANLLALGTGFSAVVVSIVMIGPKLIGLGRSISTLIPLLIDTGIAFKALASGASAAEVASIGLSGVLGGVVAPLLIAAAAATALYIAFDKLGESADVIRDIPAEMDTLSAASLLLDETTQHTQTEIDGMVESLEELSGATDTQIEALERLTEGYHADIDAMAWMQTEAQGVTDGWRGMLGAGDELGGKLWDVTGISLEAAAAMRGVGDAVMTTDERMMILKDSMAGAVGEENAKYRDAQAEIRAKIDETKLALEEAVVKFGMASEEAATHRSKLNDLKGELGELGQAHRDTMNKIIFDLMMARLATDGWTSAEADLALEVARSMGLIDEETWDAATSMNEALDEFATGEGQAAAIATIGAIASGLVGLPRNIEIRINALYTQTGVPPTATETTGGAMEGYQTGTPFVPRTGPAFLHRGEAVLPTGAAAAYRSSVANSAVTNNFNLTTQSTTRPGGLAMEFSAMQFQGAGASR